MISDITSVKLCTASDTSARLPDQIPPMISATVINELIIIERKNFSDK